MSSGTEHTSPKSPTEMAVLILRWFLGRDISTMLLLLLVVGGGYAGLKGVPAARTWLKEDLAEINGAHERDTDKVIQSFDRNMDKAIEAFKADQERDSQLIHTLLQQHSVGQPPPGQKLALP